MTSSSPPFTPTADGKVPPTEPVGISIPDDQVDPAAYVLRANDPRTRNPEFGRWLRSHGVPDDRFVTRVEFSAAHKTATVYRIKGVIPGDVQDIVVIDTGKDGRPVDDYSIVIHITPADMPPGVTL